MDLVTRGSEYQDFLNCRRKWFHGWVEKITPKRPDGKLFFGSLFHKWLECYYKNGCDVLQADAGTVAWMTEQDLSAMEQVDIDNMKVLYQGVRQNYIDKYHESDKKWNVLATEVEFLVKLDEGQFFTGTIDLVYEEDGEIKFADHKCVSSLDMYEEKSKMDRQISRYWWALDMICQGVGRIKDKETDLWVVWHELQGKEIGGFIYNLIAKDYPREVKMLKSGLPSKDKAQKTSWDKYRAKLVELDLDIADYLDILEHLQNKPDPFLRRVKVIRGQQEKYSSVMEFYHTCNDIHDVLVTIGTQPERIESMVYRNIGQQCEHMCQFKAICQTEIEGGNVQMVKNLAYKKNEERV